MKTRTQSILAQVIRWGTLVLAGLMVPSLGFSASDGAGGGGAAGSNELLIFLDPGTDAATFARDNNLTIVHGLISTPHAFVFRAANLQQATALIDHRPAGARSIDSNVVVGVAPDTPFYPNDPYYPKGGGGAQYPGQWHLENQHVPGRDSNAVGAWSLGFTGSGVTIGIVDDGLQWQHPDLNPNYVANLSFNFGSYVGSGPANDPGPVTAGNRHGTAVAGVAAARGGNADGVTGAAPWADLAGLRINFSNATLAQWVDATLYQSGGDPGQIQLKNHSYGQQTPFVSIAQAWMNALETSTTAGTINVYSAGNRRGQGVEDSNKRQINASPYSIVVAAFGSDGRYATYSNFGANVTVTAPSSSGTGFGITTTDLMGSAGYNNGSNFPDPDYTTTFGGTSAAAPLVTGTLAKVKEVQPNLDFRMAKHLLARTSRIVDPTDMTATSDGGWRTNAAGFTFNQNYGFGLIDAGALVQMAQLYTGVTPLETFETGTMTVNAQIPDNNLTGLTRSVTVSADTPLEDVMVTFSISHTRRGDLEAFLTSPSGYTSRLFYRTTADSGNHINWTFTSNAFWGENPNGLWTVQVRDVRSGTVGTWNSWSMQLWMGDLVAIPEPSSGAVLGLITIALAGFSRRRRRVPVQD